MTPIYFGSIHKCRNQSPFNSAPLIFAVFRNLVREIWFEKSDLRNLIREIWFEKSDSRNWFEKSDSRKVVDQKKSKSTFFQVGEKWFCKLGFFFWSKKSDWPEKKIWVCRANFPETLFYTFLQKWLQIKWPTSSWNFGHSLPMPSVFVIIFFNLSFESKNISLDEIFKVTNNPNQKSNIPGFIDISIKTHQFACIR